MARRCAPFRWTLLAGLLISLGQSALAIPAALLLKRIFDHSLTHSDFQELTLCGLGLLGLRLLGTAAIVGSKALNVRINGRIIVRLRRELQDRVLALPRSYLHKVGNEKVQSALIMDTERCDVCLHAMLGTVVPSVVTALALAGILTYLNWRLFLIMLLVWPLTWIFNEWIRRRTVAAVRRSNASYRVYATHSHRLVDALDSVRIHDADAVERGTGEELIEKHRQVSIPVQMLQTVYVQVQLALMTCISVVVLLAGGRAVAGGLMTLGDLLAFYTVVGLLNTALRDFSQGAYLVVVGAESLREILEILQDPAELPYSGSRRWKLEKEIRLQDVSFAYEEGMPVLRGANLSFRPGRVLALIGSNGSGKSTILSLLLGFYRPSSGELRADDQPYDELDLGDLRGQLGVVPQDPWLFADSIAANLAYGTAEPVAPEELWEALRLAAAADWVKQLPQQLETAVGERGTRLSGGQRQRLAIARALLGRPHFLILDEPTNHLDARAIEEIMRNLRDLPDAPGILLITHDQGVAAQADEIWALVEGRLERGELSSLRTR